MIERWFLRACCVVLAWAAGCAGPTGGATKKSGAASSKARAAAPAVSGSANLAGIVPIGRLTVQSESVDAGDLWLGHREELAEKHKALTPEQFRNFVIQRAAELISDKIAEMLLYQKAALRRTDDLDKRVDAYVDGELRKVVTAQHGGMQRRYEKHLEAQGLTLQQAKDRMRREFIIAGYLETEVKTKVAEPTRADLLAAFEANRESWRRPARRSMSLIDIRVSDLLPKDVSEPTREQSETAEREARARADAVLSELRGGASFADCARKYSHDSRAADGGAWGWVKPDSVRERYQPALEALQELTSKQVSGAIETPDGFFIVRCDEFEPAIEPDFVAVQPQLRDIAQRRAYNQIVTELVGELRTNARIEPPNLEQFHVAVVDAAFEQFPAGP